MKSPVIPENESARLRALREYSILDTLPEQDFEDITRIASEICRTPIALVTLIDQDRQWFKSNYGLNVKETPRDFAFCAHAINEPDTIFTVKDSRKDERFAGNPLVTANPHVIFYAGVPLVNPDGHSLGTLCVIDNEPRELTSKQLDSLRSLSNQVVKLFEFRKLNRKLHETQAEMQERNAELEQFAYVVSHEIKSPLNNIIGLTQILKLDLNERETKIIDLIEKSSVRLKSLVEGIISYHIGLSAEVRNINAIDIRSLFNEVVELLDPGREHEISLHSDSECIDTNEVAIRQILTNLVSNAIKYNDKDHIKIMVMVRCTHEGSDISVEDNGRGIDRKEFSAIFETFSTLGEKDRFNNAGTGIGLATVKKLVEKLGGAIQVESDPGKGSTFSFSLRKSAAL